MTIQPLSTVDAAIANKTLRATFESGRTRSLAWRKEQLAGLRRMIVDGDAELTAALHQDLGRPSMEAYAADIGHTKAELRHIAKHVESRMRRRKVRLFRGARAVASPVPRH